MIIVGAGVGGLASALLYARAGHTVTLLEQDPAPAATDVEAAFDASRAGAPQAHQTHGFLARLVIELRDRLPDVFDDLIAAGCITLPTTIDLGDPQPGDDDLRVIIVRRTTLEWVIRSAALAQGGVTFVHDVDVRGLLGQPASDGAPAHVTGVRTADGDRPADVVVVAAGRRSTIVDWLAELDVTVEETIHESGLMYLTRWYRLDSVAPVELDPKAGGDLGYIKFMAVPGDGDTLSVTVAVRSDDREMRRALLDADAFDAACAELPGPDRYFAEGPPDPIGGVRPMGGLLNRRRSFVDGDRPLVVGLHVVGDAHTCTNPLYGRGCALALVQAGLAVDALTEHPDDPLARAAQYEEGTRREIEPWFDSSVEMDRMGAERADGDQPLPPEAKGIAAVFVAAATDPILGRGMARFWNLVTTWNELMADPVFFGRMLEVMADPDAYPPPERVGPTRDEMLAALAELTGSAGDTNDAAPLQEIPT
ncbi:MAG: FAD-dependent oxidoreductase [Ilumatobacteraceae bacterium]